MEIVALVVGATGIAGRGVSQELLDAGARVHGLSRHREGIVPGVEHVAADLLDPASLKKAVSGIKPSHVYMTDVVPAGRPKQENIKVNAGMVRTVLEVVAPARSVKHVALVTGPQALPWTVRGLCPWRRCSADAVARGAAASGPSQFLL